MNVNIVYLQESEQKKKANTCSATFHTHIVLSCYFSLTSVPFAFAI